MQLSAIDKFHFPFSQMSPLKVETHSQLNPVVVFVHVPPLRHGWLEHVFTSVSNTTHIFKQITVSMDYVEN